MKYAHALAENVCVTFFCGIQKYDKFPHANFFSKIKIATGYYTNYEQGYYYMINVVM
jgi:hypothetical protein